jgi:hypothetical protein
MGGRSERLDQLISKGIINDEKLVCQYVTRQTNKGVWYGDNPLHDTSSILALQIILMFLLSRITHFLLSPCHQTLLISQIVVSLFFLNMINIYPFFLIELFASI